MGVKEAAIDNIITQAINNARIIRFIKEKRKEMKIKAKYKKIQ